MTRDKMTNQGAMKIKIDINPASKRKTVIPITHKVLFYHCTNGLTVSPEYYEATVKPLLMAHGIEEIRIID
jgi:hypothetical protein